MSAAHQKTRFGPWTLKYRPPPGNGPYPVLLMLHGWMGNEDVMWIFERRLPKDRLILAPRALFDAPEGYSWANKASAQYQQFADFRPAVDAIIELLDSNPLVQRGDFRQVDLVGFSQGAALSHAIAAVHPQRVRSVAGLAGFVPQGIQQRVPERPLLGKPVFIAHGSQDEIVPVQLAREGVAVLESLGARVTYCEEDVGHKLGISCMRSLAAFYTQS